MVYKLRNKSEEELEMLYINFFSNELSGEWKSLTQGSDFENENEEELKNPIF